MSEFSITSPDFNDGEEIPKIFGYKHENESPHIRFKSVPNEAKTLALIMDDPDAMAAVGKVWVHWLLANISSQVEIWRGETPARILAEDEPHASALIMDDPDAMAAVGKVWVHWLEYSGAFDEYVTNGKNDFGELGYGGPAPPDGRHTYVFKLYDLDSDLELKEGFSKQELEDAMKGHILAEAKLTGTFAP